MTEKEYVCGYGDKCLHPDSKVKASESVIIGKKHFHWDCAATKQEILDIVNTYMSYIEDKTQRPIVIRAINSLVFNSGVPLEFIHKQIDKSEKYYKDRPVMALYGLKRLYWEFEVGRNIGKR